MKYVNTLIWVFFCLIITYNDATSQRIYETTYNSINDICPISSKHIVSGNRHLDGEVNAELVTKVYVSNDNRKLMLDLDLYMKAVSTKTVIEASWTFKLQETTGEKIKGVSTSRYRSPKREIISEKTIKLPAGGFEAKPFTFHDGFPQKLIFNSTIIDYIMITGDTGTEDISHDSDCAHDSKINKIVFKKAFLHLVPDGAPLNFVVHKDCNLLYNRYKGYTADNNINTTKKNEEDIFHPPMKVSDFKWKFQKITGDPNYHIIYEKTGQKLAMNGNSVYMANKFTSNDETRWAIEELGLPKGFFRLKNKATKWYLHREKGLLDKVQSPGGWWSAMWRLDGCNKKLNNHPPSSLSCITWGNSKNNKPSYLKDDLTWGSTAYITNGNSVEAMPRFKWGITKKADKFEIEHVSKKTKLVIMQGQLELISPFKNPKVKTNVWILEPTLKHNIYRIKTAQGQYIKRTNNLNSEIRVVSYVDRNDTDFEFYFGACVKSGIL